MWNAYITLPTAAHQLDYDSGRHDHIGCQRRGHPRRRHWPQRLPRATTLAGGGGRLAGSGLTSNGNGTYRLTGTATNVTTALRALTFTASDTPNTHSTTNFTLSDVSSALVTPTTDNTTTVIDTYPAPALAPTISGTNMLCRQTILEAPISPFAGLTIGDGNAGATDTLTIQLLSSTENYLVGQTSAFVNGTLADGSGFSGLTKNQDGTYTLVGNATTVTNELDALVFTPAAPEPGTSHTNIYFMMTDKSSASDTSTIVNGASVTDTPSASSLDDLGQTIDRLYYGLLDRAPDAGNLQDYEAQINDQASNLRDVAMGMIQSGEYADLHPGPVSNAEFVQTLFEGALGHPADSKGLARHTDELTHGTSRPGVAVQIAESPEAAAISH